MTEARLTRRRRSVARTPALVDPADIPEDAAGRVALIAVRAPEDATGPEGAASATPARGTPAWLTTLFEARDGWLVVVLIAAALLVLFVIGMALLR